MQLQIWRLQALVRLLALIAKLRGDVSKNDEMIDALIRKLNGQPDRPADKPPYAGIFGTFDIEIGRQKAAEELQTVWNKLQGDLNEIDGVVDDLLRALSNLPARPADKKPYASIFPESKMVWLTPEKLRAIAPEAPSGRSEQLAPQLNRTMVEYSINTPLRQAHFLAQIAHESDRFNALEEYASGEDYEYRDDLGNTQPGDGVRFKGRGLIQVTGRANYLECGRALGVDLISNPKRLADPDLASRSAGWYWSTRQLNGDADRDDVRTVTRVINGGYNGLEDRIHLLQAAKRALGV
ncbi:glycoside hydrolase family 19 protein [Leptothermofonsia sp. ETS-13]|uniref:glycoside hydrolase family 19 protein n=1 Tax=Leptothermofonsia sp. ETS-13 TaxID=3035696 RepID=UPI003BA18560